MMKWFEGNIVDAVALSKSTNTIFVVYVEGADDMSRAMTSALDSSEVSSKLGSSDFICIKLIKDSKSHRQFTEIYKIVPVPSLFFIGDNGVPMEIIAGDISVANVSKRVVAAIAKLKVALPTPGGSTATPVTPTTSLPSNSPSVSGVEAKCERTPLATTASPSTPSAAKASPATPPANTPLVSTPPTKPASEVKDHTASAPPEEVVAVEKPFKELTAEEEKLKVAEMERVQELIKKKREETQKQEEEKERERELSRRKMGKEITMAKKTQQERELEELRKERERDRKLEIEARQRVLRQIEEDKANRAARANQVLSSAATSSAHNSSSVDSQHQTAHRSPLTSQSNEARIQFKLPDGQTRTQAFPLNTTLRDLRSFIDLNIDIPFKEYTLATTFPRREFTSRDLNSDLSELQLLPSSVLLILPVQGNRSLMKGPGWTATMSAMFWALIQPVLNIGFYLKSLITGGGAESSGTAASSESTLSNEQPSTSDTPSTQEPVSRSPFYNSLGGGKSVRKRGNVHSLSDGNDSNDENNTWNGNSTQQM